MIGDTNRVDPIQRGEVSITENKIRIIPDKQASVDITGSELIQRII